jgi:hypothetical protein
LDAFDLAVVAAAAKSAVQPAAEPASEPVTEIAPKTDGVSTRSRNTRTESKPARSRRAREQHEMVSSTTETPAVQIGVMTRPGREDSI